MVTNCIEFVGFTVVNYFVPNDLALRESWEVNDKDLKFPADKNKIIQFVQLQETPTNISKEKKDDILYILQKNIEEGKQYQNVSEVTRAAGLVQQ